MPHPKNVGRWSLLLFVLACGLTACAARLNEMAAPSNQMEPQIVTPEPATVQPTDPPLTEVVTIDPADDPFVATLTAYPTFPPGPSSELMTTVASQPPDATNPPPLPTPVIARVVNLAEGLPDGEIYVAIIQRADGTYEQYLLPVTPLATSSNFMAAMNEMVDLGEQDVFVNGYALATPPPRGEPPPNPVYEEATVTPVAAP